MQVRAPSIEQQVPRIEPRQGVVESGKFADALGESMKALEGAQAHAETEAVRLARGEGNLHTAALAVEQADIAMKLAVKVRNKVVEAYQEVMRMNV